MKKQLAPYGSWPSRITGELVTEGIRRLSEPQLDGDNCYWLETRPEKKGRTIVVCRTPDGHTLDVTPATFNIRTRIHEYGGGCYRVNKGQVYFVNDVDQRIYCCHSVSRQLPIPLTPEGPYRYADFCIDEQRQRLIAVCEIHSTGENRSDTDKKEEPENCIVAVNLDGSSAVISAAERSSTTVPNALVSGNDFYSNPRISPDGSYLSWLSWDHPDMPWDNTNCWIAEFDRSGRLQKHDKVAGGSNDGRESESVFQPQWSPTGELFFISDRHNWWNLYRYTPADKTITSIITMDAEFATPQWMFGMSTYGFLNFPHTAAIFCCYTQNGHWYAGLIDIHTRQLQTLNLPWCSIAGITCNNSNNTAMFIGASAMTLDSLVKWQPESITELASSGRPKIDTNELSAPEVIDYKNTEQQWVQGFYYAPVNARYRSDHNRELPPLLVTCHGGPTGSTSLDLNLKIQYWTNRGFAVFDINYSGSTGYGRPYRNRLKGRWGELDVEDICAGAEHLVALGKADPQRMAARGSSAGGFSVLAALTFRDTFQAGASLYGISDLALLAQDTHKFESRYLDTLIGSWPEAKATYHARSALHYVEQLNCPVIFLQGLEDMVVPPNQAEAMVNALVEKNIPVAYVTFENEGHGFRQAENIRYALDVEYAFYSHVFHLQPRGKLPKVPFVVNNSRDTK